MEWTGGCLCGAVRYRTESRPLWISHCHCQMCRRQTGSLTGSFVGFPVGSMEWSGEPPALYSSSEEVERGFCPRCGSTLTFQKAGEIDIALGTLDHAERLTPGGPPAGSADDCHIFVADGLPWVRFDDGLPRHARRPKGS